MLLRQISESGQTIPSDLNRVVRLTDYAVETRYPGLFEPVADKEYEEALVLAARCLDWVRTLLA